MTKREKVIFDTSCISGEEGHGTFLGGRSELDQFSLVADIIIPEIVIEEIRAQKHRSLVRKQGSFLSNTFHKILGFDETQTREFNIEEYITKLEDDEPLEYTTIPLTDHSVLVKMKGMALIGQAPFSENSDKGFKDAYIYFTVMEYLSSLLDGEIVYFITGDEQLKTSFEHNPRVRVVADFAEFTKYRTENFREEYFISQLHEEVDFTITPDDITGIWLNVNDNWVLQIETGGDVYRVEVDFTSREILSHCSKNISDCAENFTTTIGSFASAHEAISLLSPYSAYLSDQEIRSILKEAVDNRQLYWIAKDNDVREFLLPLFEKRGELLSEDIRADFRKRYYD